MTQARKPSGEVYFARVLTHEGVDMNAIKIGCSIRPWTRPSQICGDQPYEMEVISTFPGEYTDEKLLHRWFSEHRIGGEFFRAHATILSAAETAKSTGKNPICPDLGTDRVDWKKLDFWAFCQRHGITAKDLQECAGYKAPAQILRSLERKPEGNRSICATIMVVALRRGISFKWPNSFVATQSREAAETA